jgi:hypothetical protein
MASVTYRFFGAVFFAILEAMSQTPTDQGPVIDLTGLPESAAEAVRTIVDALRQQAVPAPPGRPSDEDWQRTFDAYIRDVAARAARYPEGFTPDDSRETVYEGRGE